MKKYTSKTLAELQSLISQLNQSGIFPHGHTGTIAEKSKVNIESIRNTLKGYAANPAAARAIIEEAENLAGIKRNKIPKRNIRKFTISEIYNQQLLPARYSQLASEQSGISAATIRQFIKSQLEGKSTYSTSEATAGAIYSIAEMNEEWELKCRAENIIQKIS